MARHPAGVVAPFSMLVPVVGISAAWLVLGEAIGPGQALGAAVVVVGVLLGSTQPGRGGRGGRGGVAGWRPRA